MKKLLIIYGLIVVMLSMNANISLAIPLTFHGGPHLWLSTDPVQPDEGGTGYVGDIGDPWFNDSYFTIDNPFNLYIYNAKKNGGPATDIQLLVAVHSAETGMGNMVNVEGIDYNNFTGTVLPPEYGSGNHGIYDDPEGTHDGRYTVVPLGFDLLPLELKEITLSYEGFSIIHVDVFSSNGYWNPPSHDVTADPPTIPEPSTVSLLCIGIAGLFAARKKCKK